MTMLIASSETHRTQRKSNPKATAARFDGVERGAGGAGKVDPSGKRRLRDDNFLLVARFETVGWRCQGKSTSKARSTATSKAGGLKTAATNSTATTRSKATASS